MRALPGCDLRGMDLSEINFDGMNLPACKLAEANLSTSNFRGANLTDAPLWRANLNNVVLDETVLDGADLEWSNLEGCTMKDARISRTIFPLQLFSPLHFLDATRTGNPLQPHSFHTNP